MHGASAVGFPGAEISFFVIDQNQVSDDAVIASPALFDFDCVRNIGSNVQSDACGSIRSCDPLRGSPFIVAADEIADGGGGYGAGGGELMRLQGIGISQINR